MMWVPLIAIGVALFLLLAVLAFLGRIESRLDDVSTALRRIEFRVGNVEGRLNIVLGSIVRSGDDRVTFAREELRVLADEQAQERVRRGLD